MEPLRSSVIRGQRDQGNAPDVLRIDGRGLSDFNMSKTQDNCVKEAFSGSRRALKRSSAKSKRPGAFALSFRAALNR